MTSTGDAPSFEADVKPMFREEDRTSMRRMFDLWSFEDVTGNAEAIYARVADGSMPCDGAWPAANVELLRRWIDQGRRP